MNDRELRELITGQAKYQIREYGNEWIQQQLESLPSRPGDRCPLGRAFADAVLKVVDNRTGAIPRPETDALREEIVGGVPESMQAGMDATDRQSLDDLVHALGQTINEYEGVTAFSAEDLLQYMGRNSAAVLVGNLFAKIRQLEEELRVAESETMRDTADRTQGGG